MKILLRSLPRCRATEKVARRDLAGLGLTNLAELTEEGARAVNGAAGGADYASIAAEAPSLISEAKKNPIFMDVTGAGRVLGDLLSSVPNKLIGGVFEVKAILRELAGGGQLRLPENFFDGKQAADAIRLNGDVLQFKSYASGRLSQLWKNIIEQAESDVRRYAERGWVDGSGSKVSGNFESYLDSGRLIRGGVSEEKVAFFADELSKWLTYRLNGAAFGQYGGQISYKVIPLK